MHMHPVLNIFDYHAKTSIALDGFREIKEELNKEEKPKAINIFYYLVRHLNFLFIKNKLPHHKKIHEADKHKVNSPPFQNFMELLLEIIKPDINLNYKTIYNLSDEQKICENKVLTSKASFNKALSTAITRIPKKSD